MDTLMRNYQIAKERYAELGVDVDSALESLKEVALSLHCWQGDDVGGFEKAGAALAGGGIQVTGNYPGRAGSMAELRADLEKVFSLLPGNHRLNLHAMYGEFGKRFVDRDEISADHFKGWAAWAGEMGLKLDFNATCFSHPRAESGFTLSSKDPAVRGFWMEHVKRSREISAFLGKRQKNPCIHNLWIPDGSKDLTVKRSGYRERLKESLDELFRTEYARAEMKDALESKLFGIGSESFVVGSHEFYLGYALCHNKMICLDMGHFHPTESLADKISALLLFTEELLLHVSRPVRWDSDHIVILNDDLLYLCQEIVRSGRIADVHLGLDFFDGTLNRIGAWVIGARALLKGLLAAFLEPLDLLKQHEDEGNYFARLALLEEAKTLPWGSVWDYYCSKRGVALDRELIGNVLDYEKSVLSQRRR